MNKLDRLLDGDDVLFLVDVDVVEQRSQGGRFPASRRTGDEDQAAIEFCISQDDLRNPELLQRKYFLGNVAEYNTGTGASLKSADAKTGQALNLVGEIDIIAL